MPLMALVVLALVNLALAGPLLCDGQQRGQLRGAGRGRSAKRTRSVAGWQQRSTRSPAAWARTRCR